MLHALLALLLCQLAGELAARSLQLPVPGPVLGMLLLVAVLVLRRGPGGELERTAEGLLSHLGLLFVPAGVGLMTHADRLGAEGVSLAVTLVVSTAAAVLVTGWVMALLMRTGRRSRT